MKFRRKLVLLATLALTVGVVVPASALAKWNVKGINITENANVEFKGSMNFQGGIVYGVACPSVEVKATLEPGTTGKVTGFKANPGCIGVSGYSNCKITAVTPVNLASWALEDFETKWIRILNFSVNFTFTGCGASEVTIGPGTITLVPDKSWSISKVTLSGTLPSTNGINMTAGGSWAMSPADTYGL